MIEMTREETIQILMTLQAVYPNFKIPDKSATVNAWHMMLKDYTYQMVQDAVVAFISLDTSGFAPTVGQVIGCMNLNGSKRLTDDLTAWALVSKALRNGTYGAQEEFDNLPEEVREAVGTPDNLRNWATADLKAVETVIQSNFLKTYRSICERKQRLMLIPEDVRNRLMCTERKLLE